MLTVLGATGFLGAHITRCLAQGPTPVRAIVRRPRATLRGLAIERVPADLCDPATLGPALAGSQVVVHAGAPYPRTSLHPESAVADAVKQTTAVLDAVAVSGARRLLFISSTATVAPAVGRPSDERDGFTHTPGFGAYHDVKWALEALVSRESRFETVIVCPAGCIGPGDWRVGTSAWLVAAARGLPAPHPDGLVSLVDVRDVGLAVARLATLPNPPARVLLSANTLHVHPLLVRLARRYGVAEPPAPLEAAQARAVADAAERAVEATGGRPALSRELVDLVTHGVPISGALASERLSFAYTPLAASLDAFDAWARSVGLIPKTHPQLEHAP